MCRETTHSPVFFDNINILRGSKVLENLQAEQKIISRKFKMVQAAMKDVHNNCDKNLEDCKEDYIDTDEFMLDYKNSYCIAQVLYRACTKKQKTILYLLFVESLRLCRIAEILDIKHNTVITHMKLIKQKAIKLNLNLNLTGG